MNIDLDGIKRKLLIKYPSFGSVIASLKFEINDNIYSNGNPTCITDGERVLCHSKALANTSKQLYLFGHEVCHVAFNHVLRREGKNPKLWNIACDAVINQLLKSDGIVIPKGSVDLEDAIGYNVEDYYNKLLDEDELNKVMNKIMDGINNQEGQSQNNQKSGESESKKQNQSQTSGSSGGSQNTNEQYENSKNKDMGHDTHSMWEEAVKRHKEKQKESLSEEKTEIIDEQKKFKEAIDERKRQTEKLMKELSKIGSRQAGTTTNREKLDINDIGTTKPLIDWRYILKEALQLDVDWSYANAEIEYGVLTPRLEAYSQPECEILLDTSKSIPQTLLKNFLRECKNILQQSRVKVGCFDTEFYGWNEVRTLEDIDTLPLRGGGGTYFSTAVQSFTKRVENKIIFTDGKAGMPKMMIDAIWIVYGNNKIKPNGGKVIYINDEQLRKLYYSYEEDNYQNSNRRR